MSIETRDIVAAITEDPLDRLERLWDATCTPPAPEGGYDAAFDDWTDEAANCFPALLAIARAARRVQEEPHIDTDARMALHAALDALAQLS